MFTQKRLLKKKEYLACKQEDEKMSIEKQMDKNLVKFFKRQGEGKRGIVKVNKQNSNNGTNKSKYINKHNEYKCY